MTREPRSEVLKVRVTPSERELLEQRAEAEQRTISDFIRIASLYGMTTTQPGELILRKPERVEQ